MDRFEIAAVIVAAGLSSRMGAFKPLLPLGESTVVGTLLATCADAGVGRTVVVTGHRAAELEEHIAGLGLPLEVSCVRNPDYATAPMARSVRLGLEAVRGCAAVLFCPVDVALWQPSTVQALIASGEPLAVPVHGGRRGHPLLIAGELVGSILAHLDDHGLKGALAAAGLERAEIAVDDLGCLLDADTPEQYERLVAYARAR